MKASRFEGSSGPLLGVWAHPDDEAFLSAGLMAKAVEAGRRVVVVTATRGEHGTADAATWPPDRLGRLRSRELMASLAALGVTEHRWLGYVDGTCAEVPIGEGADLVADIIDEVQPETIVTFGPDGMTGHPDHKSVSRWTDEAIRATSSQADLLHATISRDFLVRFEDLHERFNVFFAGPPPWTPPDRLALEMELDQEVQDAKLAALRAQASQTAGMVSEIGEDAFRAWWSVEWFADGRSQAARRAA